MTSTTGIAAAENDSDRIPRAVWTLSSVVVLGSIMSILDTTIVNIALATMSRDLHSSIAEIQWVVTGYMLSLAAVIPVSGWAARRFGAKQVWLVSVVLFTSGSVLCGFSTTTTELILFRVLQGVGGGMILPVGQLMMARAAGPKRMGRVMAIVAVPAMLAPIFGPALGGLILQNLHWSWIFFVNAPIGVIAVILGIKLLPHTKPARTDPLDFVGLALMTIGLPLFVYGLAEVGIGGSFGAANVIWPCVAGLALVGGFILWALRAKRPLLELRLYRRATFSTASIAMFCIGAGLFGSMILLPLYWQTIRHDSVIVTGMLTAPQGLGMALVMPAAGKLSDRHGGGWLSLIGVTVTAVATLPFCLIGAHTSTAYLLVAMFVRGAGIGFAFMPTMTAAFASLHKSELSDATPQLNVLQRVGGSIGTAVLAVILQRALDGAHTLDASAAGYGTAFWGAMALTAVAIIPCIVLAIAEHRARSAREQNDAQDVQALTEVAA